MKAEQKVARARKQTIGRYEIVSSIGKGSQGAVYLGRDPTLDRLVAVKILTGNDPTLNTLSDDGVPLEARISSKLNHPNIVPIFDAGEFELGPYLVFEYVKGKTLAQALEANGPMTIEAAVPVIAAILQAVATAHTAQILHLDLSPRNVLIDTDNVPRVMDFGLAQYISTAHEPQESAKGTLRYMAPEHFLGRVLGPWTDVFALGSTFYELVTGQRAMAGRSVNDIRDTIISGDVDYSLIPVGPYREAYSRFLAGAFEKSEMGRYADCSVMAEAFELFCKETELEEQGQSSGSNHSTVDFLLRRMQRTGDFPTISRTLADINRLTGDDPDANAHGLTNVILRDFALTGKLLKLVNSAFYGSRAVEITSISEAVVFLGVETVRMTANSLSFFGQMKGDSAVLKDSMTKSFLSGLIARHLAQRERLPRAEEAFICGMCQNLGENLVIFYFPDEFADITELIQSRKLDKAAAARGVLGVDYAELGTAVAKSWNLPSTILESIRGIPPGPLQEPVNPVERFRDIAVLANELANVFQCHDTEHVGPAMEEALTRFAPSISLDPAYCIKLFSAGLEKLKQYAPVFEINVESSNYCAAVQAWLDHSTHS